MRDSAEHVLLAKLRGEFDDGDIAELFRVLNPGLLHVDDQEVELRNPHASVLRLEKLLENLTAAAYSDGDVRIGLERIPRRIFPPWSIRSARFKDRRTRMPDSARNPVARSRPRPGRAAKKLEQLRKEEEELIGGFSSGRNCAASKRKPKHGKSISKNWKRKVINLRAEV